MENNHMKKWKLIVKSTLIIPFFLIFLFYLIISIIFILIQLHFYYIKDITFLTIIPHIFGIIANFKDKTYKLSQNITLWIFLKIKAIGILLHQFFSYIPLNRNAGKLFLREAIKAIYERNKNIIFIFRYSLISYLISVSIFLIYFSII
ncbi:MAG: hypothetical protein ACTSQP_21220 [Promethearchaeota archaeon]